MAYDPTEWKSRIVEFPNRFRLISLGGDLYTIVPEPGTITEYGTLVNEENMNKIEQGLYDANLWATDSGGDDAYVVNLSTTFAAGLVLPIKVSTGNTGPATLSIDNGATAKEIRKNSASGPVALATGDMKPGVHILVSDGTYWILTASVDASTLDGLHASDFMSSNKVFGNVVYSDSIPATSTLTKSIPLGGSYNFGQIIITSALANGGILATFDTNNLHTLVTGSAYYSSNLFGTAWSRRNLGYIAYANSSGNYANSYGRGVSGNNVIRINDIYINGTNLIIIFENLAASPASLNCIIDWEVW